MDKNVMIEIYEIILPFCLFTEKLQQNNILKIYKI